MTTGNQPTAPATSDAIAGGPLTLAVLRRLVHSNWRELPGSTLVVLSRDTAGNACSPLSAYRLGRYAPVYTRTGDVYPLESELAADPELRELFGPVPRDAVAALVLYPLG
jgi:hypothetical protein